MARAKGISKSQGYLARVFCVEYDLKGMCDAYGQDFMHWLIDEIVAGRINCKQDVERWSAHVAITKDYNFAKVADSYGDAIDPIEDVIAA